MKRVDIPVRAVRKELAKVLTSPHFRNSDRIAAFLRFVVNETLQGNGGSLKEYVIGTKVYELGSAFDPSQNSLVRSEARRLRSKLRSYFEEEGASDPITIALMPGSYSPTFLRRTPDQGPARDELHSPPNDLLIDRPGVAVAVVPFISSSGTEAASNFADGLTDELLHRLASIEGVRVITAGSMAQVIAHTPDAASLAKALGAQVLFDGTVRQEGQQVRITLRLIDAEGVLLWSQRFNIELQPGEAFRVQENVASALMNRVAPQLSLIRKFRASAGPELLSVYPALLSAEALLDSAEAGDLDAALGKFQAVSLSVPQYARPQCGAAQCFYWKALRGTPLGSAGLSQGKTAVLRALELDPEMVEAHSTLGAILGLEWRWTEAQVSFDHAMALGSQAVSFRQYALFLCAQKRFAAAHALLERAQEVDPFSARQQIARAKCLYLSRHFDQIGAYCKRQISLGTLPVECVLYRALADVQLHRFEEAMQSALALDHLSGENLALKASAAEIIALCGDRSHALRIQDETQLLAPPAPLSSYRKATLALSLARTDQALEFLSEALVQKEPELIWLAVEPRFDPLRSTALWSRIVKQVAGV